MNQNQKLTTKQKTKKKQNTSIQQQLKLNQEDLHQKAMVMQLVCW